MENREREGKRSLVLRSHVLPASVDGPDLGSTKGERERARMSGTDPLPFIAYLVHASYVKQIFRPIHATLFMHVQSTLLSPPGSELGGRELGVCGGLGARFCEVPGTQPFS